MTAHWRECPQQAPVTSPRTRTSTHVVDSVQPCAKLGTEKGLGHLMQLRLNPGFSLDWQCLMFSRLFDPWVSASSSNTDDAGKVYAGLGSKVSRHAENWKSSTVKNGTRKIRHHLKSSLNCEHQALVSPKASFYCYFFLPHIFLIHWRLRSSLKGGGRNGK